MDNIRATIYTLQNKNTGNVFYVGSTTQPLLNRLSGHKADCKSKARPVSVYIRNNKDNIEIESIDSFEGLNKLDLLRLEMYWISQFREWGFDLLNVTTTIKGSNEGIRINDTHINLKKIPDVLYDYLLKAQYENKLNGDSAGHSLEKTVYKIIEEHEELKKTMK